jgi:chemotaxis protein CheZ
MAAPRKIFRIEEMSSARPGERGTDAPGAPPHGELIEEIAALRAMLAAGALRPAGKTEAQVHGLQGAAIDRLVAELAAISAILRGNDAVPPLGAPTARLAHELAAITSGTEEATRRVLAAAEEIDQAANNLSAALKGKLEQDLAQDIRDIVIRIFEACNFQDLTGQRVAKVTTALALVEEKVARLIGEVASASTQAARKDGAQYLNGPRLDRDRGHVTQNEIDAMFDC